MNWNDSKGGLEESKGKGEILQLYCNLKIVIKHYNIHLGYRKIKLIRHKTATYLIFDVD